MSSPDARYTPADLLKRADEVLKAFQESSPDAVDRLEQYIAAFDALYGEGGAELESADIGASEEDLRRLANLHAEILELAGSAKEEVNHSLRSLRTKGKGLRAYTDHYPKRISTIRPRKG